MIPVYVHFKSENLKYIFEGVDFCWIVVPTSNRHNIWIYF